MDRLRWLELCFRSVTPFRSTRWRTSLKRGWNNGQTPFPPEEICKRRLTATYLLQTTRQEAQRECLESAERILKLIYALERVGTGRDVHTFRFR